LARQHTVAITLPTLGLAIGHIAWSGELACLLLAPAIIAIWSHAPSRLSAFASLVAYYLGAGYGVVSGAEAFFAQSIPGFSALLGVAIWIGYSTVLGATWCAFWGQTHKRKRVIAALLAISLPPIGIIGGFNPFLGVLAMFPGYGWLSIIVSMFAISAFTQKPKLLTTLPFIVFSLIANAVYSESTLSNWHSRETSFGQSRDSNDEFDRLMSLQRLTRTWSDEHAPGSVLLLPELVGGNWEQNKDWWRDLDLTLDARGQTVLVGVHIPVPDGSEYKNAVVTIGKHRDLKMLGRVPVPIAMWKPWAKDGARSSWTSHEVVKVAGVRVAPLICYEQLLIWPALISLSQRPDMLIAPANDWWARDTVIPRIQYQAVRVWARAFNLPFLWTTNR
jgi:hypothetical protein